MNKINEVFAINRNGITTIFSVNILGQMQSMTDIKKDTNDIKGNTDSLKKDVEIIKEDLTQIKESVTIKTGQNIERNNLSDPEESAFSELHFFAFFFKLNVMNSNFGKFGMASGHTL